MADYSKHSIPELKKIRDEVDAALAAKVEARKAELMKELHDLGMDEAPIVLPIRKAVKANPVKALYETPDKSYAWSGRGAIPTAFKKLGVKDKAGMAAYLIK